MIVSFWGVRGSIPVPGPHSLQFGGNTSCVEVRCGKQLMILDGGTGLPPLGENLVRQGIKSGIFLFSHAHWDHIQGFPFFLPGFDPEANFEIIGGEELHESMEETLSRQMTPPNFPLRLKDMGANFTFDFIKDGECLVRGDAKIEIMKLRHPDPSYGYRIRYRKATLVYATDTELPSGGADHQLAAFARNADLLILDAQFTPEEYEGRLDGRSRKGWGHSTAIHGAKLAKKTGVRRLVLFHHDPSHDDEMIRRIEREAQGIFAPTQAAYEGLVIHLGGSRS